MAIRRQTMGVKRALTKREWEIKVRSVVAAATAAVRNQDADELAQAFARAADLADPHRRLQADIQLFSLLTSAITPNPQVWGPLYLTAANALLDALRKNPLEPSRWNLLGVAVYELGQIAAAEKAFKVVKALQPDHPNVRGNLKAIRDRRGRQVRTPFGPVLTRQITQLAEQTTRLAKNVRPVPPSTQKLSLVMIVKDEQDMLGPCLDSVKDVVDEMIIVDTGSTDDTVKIAESYGAKIIDFPWTGSFAEARNVSLDHATGDWVLHLDADERIVPDDAARIRPLLARTYREGFQLVETNYTGESENAGVVTHNALRIWRHRPEYRFTGAIHEQKTDNMPIWLAERFELTPIRMLHFGYLKEVINSRDKSKRNLDLLLAEERENPSAFNQFNIGTEYLQLNDPASARTHLDRAWEELLAGEGPLSTGYGPMLAVRAVRARRETGALEAAEETRQQALGFYPDHTDLLYEGALIARERGDLAEAVQLGERMLAQGDSPTAYAGVVGLGSYIGQSMLGELYERQGRTAEAVGLYERTLADYPEYVGVIGSLARALLRRGDTPEQVIRDLTAVTDRHPTTAGLLLAHSLYEQKHVALARGLYERVLAAAPANAIARVGLVECALTDNDIEQVFELTADFADSDPTATVLLRARLFGCLLDPAAHLDEAKSLLTRAKQVGLDEYELETFDAWAAMLAGDGFRHVSPQAGLAATNLLRAALRMRMMDAAEQLIVLAKLSEMPLTARVQQLGTLFFHEGLLEFAAMEWMEWINTEGEHATPMVGLAQISLAEGRREEALAIAQAAADLNPSEQTAQRIIAALS